MSVPFILSSCVLDKEAAVRAQLGEWVVLGETRYFHSEGQCTAGLFKAKAGNVTSRIKKVHSIKTGIKLLGRGEPVAFKVDGMTPADVHKAVDQLHRGIGIAILTSGLGARGCLTPELRDVFALALQATGAIVMYDPENHALAILQRAQKQVFYARGDVG